MTLFVQGTPPRAHIALAPHNGVGNPTNNKFFLFMGQTEITSYGSHCKCSYYHKTLTFFLHDMI